MTAERPVIVFGSAGGTGASVVSALLADYRSQVPQPINSCWVDLAGTDSDVIARLGVRLDESGVGKTSRGTTCWQHDGYLATRLRLAEVVESVGRNHAVPVIDAGNHAASCAAELAALPQVVPVLTIAPRPDLLNRARTILSTWRDAGILDRTIVVISCQLPALNHIALTEMVTDAIVARVAGVVGMNYDPILGAGTSLEHGTQEKMTHETWESLDQLAALTSDAPAQQQAVVRYPVSTPPPWL